MPVQMKRTMITSLTASLGEFTVSFQMMPQDSTLMIAAVSNKKTEQNFHIMIDRQYISLQQEFFRSVFDEPQDIFEELVANFQDVVVEDGLLKFSYNYGGMKKKKKIMQINLKENSSSNFLKKYQKSSKSILKKQSTSMSQVKDEKITEEQESNLEEIVRRIVNRLGQDKIRDEKNQQQKEKRRLLDIAIEERISKINGRLEDIEGVIRRKNESDSKGEEKWGFLNETIMRIDKQISRKVESLKIESIGIKQQNDSSIKEMKKEIQIMKGTFQRCNKSFESIDLTLKNSELSEITHAKEQNMKFIEQIGKYKEDAQKIRQQTENALKEMKATIQNIHHLLLKLEEQVKVNNAMTQFSQQQHRQAKQNTERNQNFEEQIRKSNEISQKLKEYTQKSFNQMHQSFGRVQEKLKKFEADIKDTNSKFQSFHRQHQQGQQIRALQSRLYSQSVYQSLSIIKSQQDLHSQKLKQLDTIGHHFNNSHKQYYRLLNSSNTAAKITRSGQVGWYNFVNRFEICLNHRFTIKINKLSKNALIVGFCTESGLSKINNHQSLEAAYYNCSGYLIQDGASKFINVRFSSGDTIECYADLKSNRIAWITKGHEFSSCVIPKQMRNKPIFFSIMMYWTNDEVDLFI